MIEIIPAINAEDFSVVRERLAALQDVSEWVHIDIANGTFTENTLWSDPFDLTQIETALKLELHLMIAEPETQIEDWLATEAARRVIFHLGATKDPETVIRSVKESEREVGVAISPEESIEEALLFKNDADFFQILTVTPGRAGQRPAEGWEHRIEELRAQCPSCTIEVDGGMDEDAVPLAARAGASRIVAANAVFKDKNITENIKRLNALARREN